jgi:hypothetical protein
MKVELRSGRVLEVPEAFLHGGTEPPVFVISIRKSGSTMLNQLMGQIAQRVGRPLFGVGDWLFSNNVLARALHEEEALCGILRPNVIYGGFRDYPTILERSELFRGARKLVYIRDPRDALVSEFFSNAYSHSMPVAQGGDDASAELMARLRQEALAGEIQGYVLRRAKDFRHTASAFLGRLEDPQTLVLRYEDTIFDKPGLAAAICRHFGFALAPEALRACAAAVDARPAVEDPTAFVRKVTPGDHREKLSQATIEELNQILGPVLKAFGYA